MSHPLNESSFIVIYNMSFPQPRVISFYGAVPDDLTATHSAEFEPVTIRGRSSPLAAYTGGSAVSLDLTIDMHEDFIRAYGPNKTMSLAEYIKEIEALTFPRYIGGRIIPPRCIIHIGDFFKMNAYCTTQSTTWKKPIRVGEDGVRRFAAATINIQLTEIRKLSSSADEVISRGLVSDIN